MKHPSLMKVPVRRPRDPKNNGEIVRLRQRGELSSERHFPYSACCSSLIPPKTNGVKTGTANLLNVLVPQV